MKTTIIELIADASLSGAPRHLIDLVDGLNKTKKFQLAVICPPGPLVEKLKKIKDIQLEIIAMGSKFDLIAIKKIRNYLLSQQSEHQKLLLHLHGIRAGWLGQLAIRNIKIPVVYTEHNWTCNYHLKNKINEWWQLKGLKWLTRHSQKIIAVSQAVKKFLIKKNLSPAEKIEVIYHGVHLPQIVRKGDAKTLTIGSTGTLVERKNFDYLLQALKIVKNNLKLDWRAEIMGQGPLAEDLQKKIKIYQLQSKVKILKQYCDVQDTNWDIYLQTSIDESFGLAVASAMAKAIPVVATKVGAIPELVEDKTTGFLVPLNQPQVLAQAIIQLLNNKRLRQKMGEEGRKRIETNFTLEKMIQKTSDLYESVLK